jgi:hypothetical protein
MNTVTHVAHSRPRGTNRSHWVAALALALAFALPGVVSANEGGFRHNVLMRGQVLEKSRTERLWSVSGRPTVPRSGRCWT